MRTIAMRLLLAFMCVITLLILQGVFAYQGFRELRRTYQEAFSYQENMALLRAELAETRLRVYRFISTLNPEQMDTHRAVIENKLQRLERVLARHAIDRVVVKENAALYASIIHMHSDFYTKSARRLLNTRSEEVHAELLRGIVDHANAVARENENMMQHTRRKTLFITFGLLVVALGVAGVWAVLLANSLTDRRKADNALRESEERLRAIFAAAENVAFVIYDTQDPEPKVLAFSPGAEKIFGYRYDEVYRQPLSMLRLPQQTLNSSDLHAGTEAGQNDFSGETTLFRKSGESFPAIFSTHPLHGEAGEKTAVLAVGIDISERKRLQEKLQQSQKMESIGNLAGGIAHDFNNILASVIGFTELALEDVPDDSPAADSLQEVFAAGRRAKDLVQQILAFARRSDEDLKPIRISIITQEVLKFLRSSIPTTIDIQPQIESDSLIMGNPTQVHQILMNLCTNAAQAMEAAGGTLAVTLKDVAVDRSFDRRRFGLRKGDYLEIKVSDTGEGIPPDRINKIFEPYFTTKSPGEGTGMGLAVVQGIVESYGGKIDVESRLGRGTVFRIYLPVTRKPREQKSEPAETLPTGTESILFVDDEAPVAKMGAQTLARLGYRVTQQTSSTEALALFTSRPEDFDLVVTDMTMPAMTGDRLAAEIMTVRPDVPVILCTGYSKQVSEETATEMGIRAFVFKPIVKAELAKTVRRVLDD